MYYENEYNVTCLLKQSLGFGRNEQMVQNLQGAHVHSPRPLDSLTSKVACKALGIKELKWEAMMLHGEEQNGQIYRELNPQGLVPFLVDGNAKMAQSLAIMEYLGKTSGLCPTLKAGTLA